MRVMRAVMETYLTRVTMQQVTRHTSHVTRHTSHVTRHTSHITVTHHTSHITRHTSHVTRHTSHVTHHSHTSHVTRHTSHVTHHTSHDTLEQLEPHHERVDGVYDFEGLERVSGGQEEGGGYWGGGGMRLEGNIGDVARDVSRDTCVGVCQHSHEGDDGLGESYMVVTITAAVACSWKTREHHTSCAHEAASHIKHHTSHITHHTSHITHHTSHITHHTPTAAQSAPAPDLVLKPPSQQKHKQVEYVHLVPELQQQRVTQTPPTHCMPHKHHQLMACHTNATNSWHGTQTPPTHG
jgi:hypothetical protein